RCMISDRPALPERFSARRRTLRLPRLGWSIVGGLNCGEPALPAVLVHEMIDAAARLARGDAELDVVAAYWWTMKASVSSAPRPARVIACPIAFVLQRQACSSR